MANTKSATKRARQSIARSVHNRSVRTRLRSLQRRVRVAGKPTAEELRALISAIDKAAQRGIIHCSAAYFPAKYKFTVPLIALFISDAVLNFHYGAAIVDPLILCRYLVLALVGLVGFLLRNRVSLKTLLPASIVGSTVFYAITNAFAWLSDPGYAKNFAGLIQALTVGLPQYSSTPSWLFFRNSLFCDLLFTLLFVAFMSFGRNSARSHAEPTLPRVA